MRVGHFVSLAAAKRGFAHVVSGHVQVPLHSLGLLHDAGHVSALITNRHGEERETPFCMPDDVPIHYVGDSRRRADVAKFPGKTHQGLNPFLLAKQVSEIRQIAREQELDVLHFFGHTRTAMLGGAVARTRPGMPVVASVCTAGVGPQLGRAQRILLDSLAGIAVPTASSQASLRRAGIATQIMRHGIVRSLDPDDTEADPDLRRRVVFWRNPHRDNGADICLAAFDRLADEFPDVVFDMALRPDFEEIDGIDEAAARHPNLHVHRYPYEAEVSLEGLLAEAICAVMPFRKLSLDPQMAILETLATGVPVIASDIHSVGEFVIDGQTGRLLEGNDVDQYVAAIRQYLLDPDLAAAHGAGARQHLRDHWNWDLWVDELIALYRSVGS